MRPHARTTAGHAAGRLALLVLCTKLASVAPANAAQGGLRAGGDPVPAAAGPAGAKGVAGVQQPASATGPQAPAAAQAPRGSDRAHDASSAGPPGGVGRPPVASGGVTAAPNASDEVADRLGRRLRCPVCQGMPIGDSPASMAQDMMRQVRRLRSEGQNEDAIVDYFTARYGAWVLLDPPKEGFALWLWGLPPVALLLGVAAVGWHVRRRAQAPVVTGADGELGQARVAATHPTEAAPAAAHADTLPSDLIASSPNDAAQLLAAVRQTTEAD